MTEIIRANRWPGRPTKLTDEQLDFIRGSKLPGTVLAKRFGISESRVSQIRNKPWTMHVRRYANDNLNRSN